MAIDAKRAKRLSELERASFLRYCHLVGETPERVEAKLMPEIRAKVQERFVAAKDKFVRRYVRDVESKWGEVLKGTYLDLNRVIVDMEKDHFVSTLTEGQGQLPINYGYLSALAARLDIPAPLPGVPASLQLLLDQIPTYNNFDLEFNAFLRADTVLDHVPAVCVYPHLFGSLQELIDMAWPLITDEKQDLRPPVQVIERAAASGFLSACIECLATIFCEQVDISREFEVDRLSRWGSDGLMCLDLLSGGAWSFIWFHEYGHLLLGHLPRGPGHAVEFEADAFAKIALTAHLKDIPESAATWLIVGVVFAFLAMRAIEARRQVGPSVTHPPTQERLDRFVGKSAYLQALAKSAGSVIAPALERRWGVRAFV